MIKDDKWIKVFQIDWKPDQNEKKEKILKVVSRLYCNESLESVSEIVVFKTFADFDHLYKSLFSIYQNIYNQEPFPIFFSLDQDRDESSLSPQEWEERKQACLKLLEYSSRFQPLFTSNVFIRFFNQDNQIHNLQDNVKPKQSLYLPKNCEEKRSSFKYSKPLRPTIDIDHHLQSLFETFEKETNQSKTHEDDWIQLVINSCHSSQNKADFIDTKDKEERDKQANLSTLPQPFESYSSQAKEDNPNQAKNERSENLNTYLLDSAVLIEQAQAHEEVSEYEAAFESYKCAICILLEGVKSESDLIRKEAIRRKILNYLKKAENIYNQKIRQVNSSKLKPKNEYSQSMLVGSAQELLNFKVVGVIGKLQLVQDILTGIIYIMKVIYKLQYLTQPFFPQNIPNMVQIYRVYETDYAHFLLLQYVDRAKSWDYAFSKYSSSDPFLCVNCNYENNYDLNSYFSQEMKLTEEDDDDDGDGDGENDERSENVDVESKTDVEDETHRLSSHSGSVSSINLIDELNCSYSKSYSKLCTVYALEKEEQAEPTDLAQFESKAQKQNSSSYFKAQPALISKHSEPEAKFETFGITYLLSRARTLLKNVDETLRVTKKEKGFNKLSFLKNSKSSVDGQEWRPKEKVSSYIESCDLNTNEAYLNEQEAKKWIWQLITALDRLHLNHIIFGDLKPKNLLLDLNEDNLILTYKFSIDSKFTLTDDLISRWSMYCAPEIFSNPSKIDHCVDWWSVGVIAYEMITKQVRCSI